MTLFADQAAIVAELNADRMVLVGRRYFPGVTLGDDYLYTKLLAAEKSLERQLRVFLEPVEVLPQSATQAERDAFDNHTVEIPDPDNPGGPNLTVSAPIRWIEEPGYDLSPGFFQGDSWGFIQARNKPIIAVHSIKFIYPQPSSQVFEVPTDWLRVDKKYGQLSMVPSGVQAFAAPVSTWMMQVMGGGRTIPSMIQVRYRVGLEDAANQHPDVVDLIKKAAVLSILQDAFLPQSGSQSIDGMSQSFGADVDKMGEMIDKKVEALRQALQGIRFGVL